ncbi:MAG: GlsB/YeaQ/YmgE family stress response membrane protein [Blastocatellia bacterium]
MDMNSLIVALLIGAAAGWLAGVVMKGRGFGTVGNIIVGIIGSFIGGWLFSALKISIASGALGTLITSVIGAVVLLFVVGLVKR